MNERIHIFSRTYLRTVMCIALLLFPMMLNAQLRSISAFAGYSSTFSKRVNVTNADAVGMGIDVVYSVSENVNIGIRGGYSLYSVNQTDQLNGWGWRFWNDRYLNKIQADMKADPSLSAVIGSVQKMDLIPVTLHGEYLFSVAEDLTVAPTLGIGAAFYQRRLYADETWTKTFPAADYSFTYNFRNFAPSKKGNPLFAVVGASAHYKMFSSVGLISSLLYTQYLDTPDRFGYNGFIFSNELTVRLGLEFFY
ncbi:MAG: hypothetical protein ACOYNS_15195 [Bacteroidota bacterium]